jgi:hypothetical protein
MITGTSGRIALALGKNVDFSRRGIKGPFQGDIEALRLSAGTVIGKIEAFLDEGIHVNRTTFTRPFARMQQHVLDDRVSSLAVLHDLVEIVAQGIGKLINLHTRLFGQWRVAANLSCGWGRHAELGPCFRCPKS